jgi:hypothetical protein
LITHVSENSIVCTRCDGSFDEVLRDSEGNDG